MGKHTIGRGPHPKRRRHIRSGAALSAVALFTGVALTASAAPGVVSAADGCIDELEIETPGEQAAVFSTVHLEPGETFQADITHWTSHPAALTFRTSFNSEARLSILRSDGFPGDTVRHDGFAADGPWDADGFSSDGVFSYTNPTNSSHTEFVFEVGAWNRPSTDIIGRTKADGFSTCVSPHSPPERPTASCSTMPAMRADFSDVARSEPFSMPANGRLDLDIMDSRTFGWSDEGYVLQRHGDWNYRVRLYDAATGAQVTSRTYTSEGFYWAREAYVDVNGAAVFNSSTPREVFLELRTWFTRGGGQPQTTPIAARLNGEDICLESTDSTVTWDAEPSCRADDTSGVAAQVRNKTGATADYVVELRNALTNQWVHGSHAHQIGAGDTATVALGGVPPGRWKLTVLENGEPLSPSTWMTISGRECDDVLTWPSVPSCATDFTPAIDVLVRNDGAASATYRIVVRDLVDGRFVHGSHETTLLPGQERNLRLGGMPNGSYNVVVVADGVDIGENRYFFDLANCDRATSTTAMIGEPGCSSDPAEGATLEITITNSGGSAQDYRFEVGPQSFGPVSVPADSTITFALSDIQEGIHSASVFLVDDDSLIAIRENLPFSCSDQIAICPTNPSFEFRYGASTWDQVPRSLPYINAVKIRVDTTGAEGRVHVMVNGQVHPDSSSYPGNSGMRNLVARDREALTKWTRDAFVQVAVVPDGGDLEDAIPCGAPSVVTAPVTRDGSTLEAPDGGLICTLREVQGGEDRTQCEALFSNVTSERYFWLSRLPDAEHNNIELNCGAYESLGNAFGLFPGFQGVAAYGEVTSIMCSEISADLNTSFRQTLSGLETGLDNGQCLVIFAFSGAGDSDAGHALIGEADNPNCDPRYTKSWPDLDTFIREDWCANFPDWEFVEYEIDGSNRCTPWEQSPPSPAVLRANLRANETQPPQTAAHHIVAGDQNDSLIDEARQILIDFQIDINSAENGIFLPSNCNSANPSGHSVHSKIHTKQYFTYVNTLLRPATTKEEVIEALDDVRQMLRTSDAWQFYRRPCPPRLQPPSLSIDGDDVTFTWLTAHGALDYQIYWFDGDGQRLEIDRSSLPSDSIDVAGRTGEVCARVRAWNEPLMEKPSPFTSNKESMPCLTLP